MRNEYDYSTMHIDVSLMISLMICINQVIQESLASARQPCTSKTDFDVKLALKVILGHLFCNQLQADKV